MRLDELLRLVLMNVRQNKFKVFLTSLGIIVGTATIVMVIAIGEGGKADVAEQFKTLNAGTVKIAASDASPLDFAMMGDRMEMMGGMPSGAGMGQSGGGFSAGASAGRSEKNNASSGKGMSGGGGNNAFASSNTYMLDEENLSDILFFVPDIITGAIFATTDQDVLGGNLEEAVSYTIVGTQNSYQQISNLSLLMGSFITQTEAQNTTRCVVLGYQVAIDLFDSVQDAYDSKIEIDGRTYVVNGILAEVGAVTAGVVPDESIFMPYTTAEKYLFARDISPEISVLATDVGAVPSVMDNIERVLTQSNPDTIFTITDAGATMEAAMESANTLSLLLMAVAIIVFIVGGIGIMNVLFVSVKERTREIGVLKAIGTKKSDILLLFLLEAGMIGFLGGAIGVLCSFGIVPLMAYTDITVVLTSDAVVLAFAFAIITGTIFGFYPALNASNLIPIQALNDE